MSTAPFLETDNAECLVKEKNTNDGISSSLNNTRQHMKSGILLNIFDVYLLDNLYEGILRNVTFTAC